MSNKIFISWHNDEQRIGEKISKCFHDYFDKIFGNHIKAFASNVDIKHGWNDELSKALDDCPYAILILTPQALDSAWMPYEYGVLRQKNENIWCYRFGNVGKDKTPFAINQYLDFSEDEISNMLDDISRQEFAAKEFDVKVLTDIENRIKEFVPKLISDVNEIANNINYISNREIRIKYEELLKNGFDKESNQIITKLKTENDSLNSKNQYLLQENTDLKKHVTELETQCIHNIIDLGLPSGTLWADRNIGASSPEDYGYFVAWGELKAKEGWYDDENYKYHDQPETLPSLNDAATFKWGCDWCMPTEEQFKELVEKCDHKWMEINGINGVELTSKINGNRIFLPAAGSRSPKPGGNGEMGYYWSSSCDLGSKEAAWLLFFNNDSCGLQLNYRRYGFSIRAVQTKNN